MKIKKVSSIKKIVSMAFVIATIVVFGTTADASNKATKQEERIVGKYTQEFGKASIKVKESNKKTKEQKEYEKEALEKFHQEFEKAGIEMKKDGIYYKKDLVRIFWDVGSSSFNPKGSVDIEITRDKDACTGSIIKVEYIPEERAEKYISGKDYPEEVKAKWRKQWKKQ